MGTLIQILDYLLRTFFSLLLLVVMLRFLLQVVRADFYNPISQFIVKVTNPLLLPLRKLVPGLWGYDMAAADPSLAFFQSGPICYCRSNVPTPSIHPFGNSLFRNT